MLAKIQDLQYNHECYMALVLVKYEDLFQLVSGYQKAQKGFAIVGYSAASVPKSTSM